MCLSNSNTMPRWNMWGQYHYVSYPNYLLPQAPVLCVDGSCTGSVSDCSFPLFCPIYSPIRCSDGSCTGSYEQCTSGLVCPASIPVRCPDGQCSISVLACPNPLTQLECPSPQIRCPSGHCALSFTSCPTTVSCGVDLIRTAISGAFLPAGVTPVIFVMIVTSEGGDYRWAIRRYHARQRPRHHPRGKPLERAAWRARWTTARSEKIRSFSGTAVVLGSAACRNGWRGCRLTADSWQRPGSGSGLRRVAYGAATRWRGRASAAGRGRRWLRG